MWKSCFATASSAFTGLGSAILLLSAFSYNPVAVAGIKPPSKPCVCEVYGGLCPSTADYSCVTNEFCGYCECVEVGDPEYGACEDPDNS